MDSWNNANVSRQDVFDDLATMIKAFGNGRRLELLELLAQGEHSVEGLANLSGMATTTTSNNLQVLKHNGLVTTRRNGTTIYYRLAGDDVLELFVAAKRVALQRHAPLRQSVATYLNSPRSQGPTLDPAKVTADMFILDVRPPKEYDAGHFPSAVNIPAAEIEARLDELPRSKQVVVYCRGELCRLGRETAVTLRGHGLDAIALDEGIAEWRGGKEIELDHAS